MSQALEQRELVVTTQDALLRGVALSLSSDALSLRLWDGGVQDLAAESVTALEPVAGPLRSLRDPWPVELDARSMAELREALFAPGANAYALLNGRGPAELVAAATCLYRYRLDPEQARGAPYLLALQPDDAQTELAYEAFEAGTCTFVRSPAALRPLLHHLRAFRRVTDGRNGRAIFFRFQDPAILRAYLRTVDGHDAASVFGAAEQEGEEASSACPVCNTDLPADVSSCAWCSGVFAGPPGARFLIEALFLPLGAGDGALRSRPWPREPGRRRPVPRRRGPSRLTVRLEQLKALGEDASKRAGDPSQLRAQLRETVRRIHTDQCRHLGDEAVDAAVDRALERCDGYRIWDRYNVTRFLNVMFMTYMDFDERPQLWTWREVLEDCELDANARMDRVRALAAAEAEVLEAASEELEFEEAED